MKKKIFIYTAIYLILMVIITLILINKLNLLITASMPITIIFVVIILKNTFNSKPKNSSLVFTESSSINTQNLKQISTRPFLFGIENKIISDEILFFNNDELVAVNKQYEKAVFKLTEITELSKTSTIINNHKIWQIIIKRENEPEIIFKFAHNHTIWNKSFTQFIDRMNRVNPKAVKTKFIGLTNNFFR